MYNPDNISPSPTPIPGLQSKANQILTYLQGTKVYQLEDREALLRTRDEAHPDADTSPKNIFYSLQYSIQVSTEPLSFPSST